MSLTALPQFNRPPAAPSRRPWKLTLIPPSLCGPRCEVRHSSYIHHRISWTLSHPPPQGKAVLCEKSNFQHSTYSTYCTLRGRNPLGPLMASEPTVITPNHIHGPLQALPKGSQQPNPVRLCFQCFCFHPWCVPASGQMASKSNADATATIQALLTLLLQTVSSVHSALSFNPPSCGPHAEQTFKVVVIKSRHPGQKLSKYSVTGTGEYAVPPQTMRAKHKNRNIFAIANLQLVKGRHEVWRRVWCGVVWCGVVWCGVVLCAKGTITHRQRPGCLAHRKMQNEWALNLDPKTEQKPCALQVGQEHLQGSPVWLLG